MRSCNFNNCVSLYVRTHLLAPLAGSAPVFSFSSARMNDQKSPANKRCAAHFA